MGDFNYMLIMPVIVLTTYGLIALCTVPLARGNTRILGAIALMGMGMSGAFLLRLWGLWRSLGPQDTAFGTVRVDGFGLYFSFILLLIGFLTVLYSMTFLEREHADQGEFYPLILFCLAGMLMMLHTTHLIMIFIGLEVFSLALYVLTGLTRMRVRSVEASLKYFLLGAFSSGFFAYGLALLYGATGSLELARIGAAATNEPSRMLWLGLGLVLIGLAFKIAVFPFHQWVPDVYEGAPTNVTGFMAAATKTAAFAVLLRLLMGAFGDSSEIWVPLITILSILTMTVANLVALAQTNLKRLLAYSSIAHAGYLLIAVVCSPEAGVKAIVFYLTAYALMTVGAFAALSAVGRGDVESEQASSNDRVLVRLESPGGMVHSYGLAASQLSRIKAANLRLIIAVDQVAASGGYMMACVADEIIAAPFAVVGSIGVVAELPNFHRLLKHNKVDYEQHTAGEYKRTLTMFSENTDAARLKFKQELEETHDLFKLFITDNRPSLDIEKVATGEHWYGTQALKLGLIDKIQTSDDFVVNAASEEDVFEIAFQVKKPLAERLSFSIQSAIEKGFLSVWQKSIESRLFK